MTMPRPRIQFDRARRRNPRLLALAALAIVAVAIGVALLLRQPDLTPPAASPVVRAPASAPGAAPVAAARLASPIDGRAAASAAIGGPEIKDECVRALLGPPSAWTDAAPRVLGLLRFRSAADDARRALQARGDELSLAAAALLHAGAGLSEAGEPDAGRRRAAQQDLARIAQGSSDPRVWAMAYPVCHGQTRGNCQLLSAEQWARLDPDNGAPWYYIAQTAMDRNDGAAADAAMRRFTEAPRIVHGNGEAFASLIDPEPAGADGTAGTTRLSTVLIGARSAFLPGYSPFFTYCFGEGRGEGAPVLVGRAQTCQKIAQVLGTRSQTLLERGIGGALAHRLGLDSAEAIRDERTAISNALAEPMSPGHDCATMRRQALQIRDTLRWGEVPAAMRLIEASDRPLAQRVERERARRLREAAARSASAPAARPMASAPRSVS